MNRRERQRFETTFQKYFLAGLSSLGVLGILAVHPSVADASSFAGRLSLGPTYMRNDARGANHDSGGPGSSAQLDAGLQLSAPLVAHATLFYDYSRWLELDENIAGPYEGATLGLGLGATARFVGLSLGGAVGAQLTRFPQNDDPASGSNAAGVGPFISFAGGYVWTIEGATNAGVHTVLRYRHSTDDTNSVVYDPTGYHLGLVLSVGLDGDALLGP